MTFRIVFVLISVEAEGSVCLQIQWTFPVTTSQLRRSEAEGPQVTERVASQSRLHVVMT